MIDKLSSKLTKIVKIAPQDIKKYECAYCMRQPLRHITKNIERFIKVKNSVVIATDSICKRQKYPLRSF